MDMEMAFVSPDQIRTYIGTMLLEIIHHLYPTKKLLHDTIPIYTYQYVMDTYGSDKPDIRYGMHLHDITSIVSQSSFAVFAKVIALGGIVKCLTVKHELTRKNIEDLTQVAISRGLG
jgi:aspartyl-tRNA synthetase